MVLFSQYYSCAAPLSLLNHSNEPVISAARRPSSPAGVELGEKAVINTSSFNIWSPRNGNSSKHGVRLFWFSYMNKLCVWTWVRNSVFFKLLTVVCVFGPVWCWCCPAVASAACPVSPASSLVTELYERSPLGHDHAAPLLAFSLIPSSTEGT